MAVETELKLRIAPLQLARLKRHRFLKTCQLSSPHTRRLHNIYFDTPQLQLQQARMALRLRRDGRQWLQTLKGGGMVKAGLHQRNEWEVPVKRKALDFSSPETASWLIRLPPPLTLQPVFVTDFIRNSRMLAWHGALIELSMDQGEVRIDECSVPICELELELKSGEPQQLYELALALLEVVPFALESVSKAELGYRLLAGDQGDPVKEEILSPAQTDMLARVLREQISSCKSHF